MANLNFIDIIVLAILFSSILVGFTRGLISEFLSLATLIAAFFVAITFATPLANVFTNSPTVQGAINQTSNAIGSSTAQPASYLALGLSFTVLFAGTVIAGFIIKTILNMAFQTGILGIGNRFLGAAFGFVKGFLITIVIMFIMQLTPLSEESWWRESYFVNIFRPSVEWLSELVSPTLATVKSRVNDELQNVSSDLQRISR